MTDLDFRLNLRPRRPRLPRLAIAPAFLLAAGCALLFPLGAVDAVLTTKGSGYNDNPGIELAMIITALVIAAVVSIAVIDPRVKNDRQMPGLFVCMGTAILCTAFLLGVYQAGTWVPYLLHLDGLTVNDRVEGSELEVEGILVLQAFLAGAASIFVGCIAGFLTWVYQFIPGAAR